MIAGLVQVLAALQLAVPTYCATTERAFVRSAEVNVRTSAYYMPRGYDEHGPRIVLNPATCGHVLTGTRYGALVYAHEVAHWRQDLAGKPLDETEATQAALQRHRYWVRRLRPLAIRPHSPEQEYDLVVIGG